MIECWEEDCRISYEDGRFVVEEGWDDFPVVEVSWYGAAAYCNFLSEMQGFEPVYEEMFWDPDPEAGGFRMPTSHEWEYAARGGNLSHGYPFSGSDNAGDVAWYLDNSGNGPHPVAQKQPNELGLYDMSGNVWEFVDDKFGIYPGIFNTGVLNNGLYVSYRVWRGGGFNSDDVNVHKFVQMIDLPGLLQGNEDLGFRVVLQEGK
jgi:formylglycine-generating enzyme required for sulfatase activity